MTVAGVPCARSRRTGWWDHLTTTLTAERTFCSGVEQRPMFRREAPNADSAPGSEAGKGVVPSADPHVGRGYQRIPRRLPL